MFALFLAAAAALVVNDPTVTTVEPPDKTYTAQVIVMRNGDGEQAQTIELQGAPHGTVKIIGGPHVKVVREAEFPKIWIGVRVTPVPAPLAAHIGADGVMIANVMAGSPADEAGLEQYDVVVAFNDRELKTPADLTAAIAEAQSGELAKLTVLRQAQRQQMRIRPEQRPDEIAGEWKYDELEDTFLNDALEFKGHKLFMGPDQKWIMEDLGNLHGLPDLLKDLHGWQWGGEDSPQWFDPNHPDLDVFQDLPGQHGLGFFYGGPEDGDAEMSLSIAIKEDDGSSTAITRGPDGKIEVKRVDAEGNESSATYDNMEALQEGDPEAHALLSGTGGSGKGRVFMRMTPQGNRALELRKEFQIDVQEKLTQAMEQARRAQRDAEGAYQDALKQAQEALERAQQHMPEQETEEEAVVDELAPPAGGAAELLGASADDNGRIRVWTREGGKVVTYEFQGVEQFQAAAPELYEQAKGLFE